MRILMLGNSFTAANDLPQRLAQLTGAEVMAHTRGGARLAEQLNPQDKTGRQDPGRSGGRALGFRHSPGDEPRAHLLSPELFHQRKATL